MNRRKKWFYKWRVKRRRVYVQQALDFEFPQFLDFLIGCQMHDMLGYTWFWW